MKIPTTTREDYLKAVLVLEKRHGSVRSIDVSRYLGVSKPSVCRAMATLTEGQFLRMDDDYFLHLTESGLEIAETTYERHCFFTRQLMAVGVDRQTAEEDACKLEHAISPVSFEKLKSHLEPDDTPPQRTRAYPSEGSVVIARFGSLIS